MPNAQLNIVDFFSPCRLLTLLFDQYISCFSANAGSQKPQLWCIRLNSVGSVASAIMLQIMQTKEQISSRLATA